MERNLRNEGGVSLRTPPSALQGPQSSNAMQNSHTGNGVGVLFCIRGPPRDSAVAVWLNCFRTPRSLSIRTLTQMPDTELQTLTKAYNATATLIRKALTDLGAAEFSVLRGCPMVADRLIGEAALTLADAQQCLEMIKAKQDELCEAVRHG